MASEALSNLQFIGGRSLPLIRQNEVAECGNACLAMVASYYGFKTDIASLRRRFPTTAQGMTLRTLADMSNKIGLATRALKAEVQDLKRVHLPAILHWDLNHFVVLKKLTKNRAVIHDPARGDLTLGLEELGNHFTGIVLELMPATGFQRADERNKLAFTSLWSSMQGLGGALTQVLLLSLVLLAYTIAAPQYMQITIDTVLPSLDKDLLITLALGFGLFLVINVVANVLRDLVILYAGSKLAYQISINLFQHLIRLPLPFFERRHIGDIVSRFSSIEPIRQFLTNGVVGGVVDGIMALVTLGLMFAYSPKLAVISLGSLALYVALRLAMFRPFRTASEREIVSRAAEHTNFIETVRGILSIKAFSQEDQRQQRWHNLLADAVNQSVRVQFLTIAFNSSAVLIRGLEQVIIIYLAAMMAIDAAITVGMIFAFMAYRGQFADNTARLVELIIDFRMLDLHLERLADIALEERTDGGHGTFEIKHGKCEATNLSFAYDNSAPLLFQDASFVIEPGESVAVVGPSGCGKTTLLKILMGLFQPVSGDFKVDGKTIQQIGNPNYRSQIAAVMQDDQLFSGTVAENIAFFSSDIDMERVLSCAAKACVHEDIVRLPMGYETFIGDMGAVFSAGQLQRLMLARALYQEPKILFMDEGTAHLDVETERAVNNSTSNLGMTRIIVAHRPETIEMADRVLMIESETIIEVETEKQK
ncbi:peptidase domain-containing ABC transporter [Roseibium alexandrii]|uniref:ABC-type bacteriocin/lantibiotic exporter n=1 Tax=Roseibium alexandrii (strain DSM 17067 / NCIMB 14079 / DFL-11) TaxID=244592 RepID=A0A5E8H434_ROSAD|nr:peptidase domain-containing ABC transporter [Roseibium alexandrii]EEE46742.1 ABC-type bacteriocin/lantibiotic exporter [Roseibium alexandrii DFL-11]